MRVETIASALRHALALIVVGGSLVGLSACDGANETTDGRTVRLTITSTSGSPFAFAAEIDADRHFSIGGTVSSAAPYSQDFETPGCRTTGPVQLCLATATARQTRTSLPWTVCLESLSGGQRQCGTSVPTVSLIIDR